MNARLPLVSIVIPTFNRCEFLKETLTSILSQSYKNFEVLIVSDNSSDDTANVIAAFNDRRCKLFVLQNKSNGPAHVRNYGISKANGFFVAFCDDDDIWMPDKLEKQINLMQAKDNIAIVATNVIYFGKVDQSFLFLASIKALINKITFLPIKYLLAFYNCLVISSVVIRKSILDQYSFNEGDEYQGHEDLDLWLLICAFRKAVVLTENLTYYRVHKNQLSTKLNKTYKKHSLLILRRRFADFNFLQKCIYFCRLFIYKIFRY